MAHPLVVGIGEVLWDMLPGGKQLGGGPANFAYHAAALGACGVVVSRVGDDDFGWNILERLDALQIDRQRVSVDPEQPTGRVDVTLDRSGAPRYVIHEPVAWDFLAADAELLDLAARADAVCFGTLAQRSAASRDAIRSFLGAARPDCLRVFDINLRQSYYSADVVDSSLRITDVLKLNDEELPTVARLLGLPAAEVTEPADAIAGLMSRYPLRLVALTRGGRGSLLVSRDGETSDHPGVPAPAIADTVGAGDAFTAALVTGLLGKLPLQRINEVANRLAAYVCTQPGATPAVPPAFRDAPRAG